MISRLLLYRLIKFPGQIPSVNLHIMSVSSFESLNSPSFSRRLRTIHALASVIKCQPSINRKDACTAHIIGRSLFVDSTASTVDAEFPSTGKSGIVDRMCISRPHITPPLSPPKKREQTLSLIWQVFRVQ